MIRYELQLEKIIPIENLSGEERQQEYTNEMTTLAVIHAKDDNDAMKCIKKYQAELSMRSK